MNTMEIFKILYFFCIKEIKKISAKYCYLTEVSSLKRTTTSFVYEKTNSKTTVHLNSHYFATTQNNLFNMYEMTFNFFFLAILSKENLNVASS